jgi:peptide/nickel transport system permease protein
VSRSFARIVIRDLLRHWSARWALSVIALLVIAAIIGAFLHRSSANPGRHRANGEHPPSRAHLLGTDQYSRDLLTRILSGATVSLSVALLSVVLSMTLGTAYGLVAGYFGGRIDGFMMRLLDGFLSIPRVLLLIAVLALWRPVPISGLIFLIGVTGWFSISRVVRAETLVARRLEYVEAARALGTSDVAFCGVICCQTSRPL